MSRQQHDDENMSASVWRCFATTQNQNNLENERQRYHNGSGESFMVLVRVLEFEWRTFEEPDR